MRFGFLVLFWSIGGKSTEMAQPLFGVCDRVRFACLVMYSDSVITDTSTGRVFFKFKCSRYITKRRIVSKLLLSEKMSYPYLISIFFDDIFSDENWIRTLHSTSACRWLWPLLSFLPSSVSSCCGSCVVNTADIRPCFLLEHQVKLTISSPLTLRVLN